MNAVFLITVRLGSTRLPQKALLDICGRTVLGHTIERLRRSRKTTTIVVCTSTNPNDDPLVDAARREGVECFRGDEDDVLLRMRDAASHFSADYVLNAGGDCPLIDPVYADRIVDAYERTGADLIRALDLPHGAYGYGLRPGAIEQAVAIKDSNDTAAWGRYFTDTDLFSVYDLPVDAVHRRPDLRMTLDYVEDLAFFQAVVAGVAPHDPALGLDAVLAFLDAHPEVVALNSQREADYRRRFSVESEIGLKSRHAVGRAVIVGAGSIGQRHIRNLRALGITDIMAIRTHRGHVQTLDERLGVREVTSWDAVAEARPDIGFVCNPTALHVDAARQLVAHVRGLFIEKPMAMSVDEAAPLLDELNDRRIVSFVGHNLPFHPALQAVRARIGDATLGSPIAFQCQAGQWLPDWHPGEDLRRMSYARAELGGGALRTLIHEIHLAIEMLGPPVDVRCVLTPNASLPLDVDVMADLIVRHVGGAVSQIHLDFLQRVLHRGGTIACERGWLSYDLVAGSATANAPTCAEELCTQPAFDWNQSYGDEMSTFLRFVREGRTRHEHDAWHALPSIAVVDAAFRSAASGQAVAVAQMSDSRAAAAHK